MTLSTQLLFGKILILEISTGENNDSGMDETRAEFIRDIHPILTSTTICLASKNESLRSPAAYHKRRLVVIGQSSKGDWRRVCKTNEKDKSEATFAYRQLNGKVLER
jgi:hypothetical protein